MGLPPVEIADLPQDSSVELMMGALSTWWETTIRQLREKLDLSDAKMVQAYQRRPRLGSMDLRAVLKPGMKVIMR